MGEGNFSKKSVGAGQEIFDFKQEKRVNFLKGASGNFRRKIEHCIFAV